MSSEAKPATMVARDDSRDRGLQVPMMPATNHSAVARLIHGARSVVPYANYTAQKLGKPGIVGVALSFFSIAVLVSTNLPLREQIASDTATLQQLENGSDQASVTAAISTPQMQFETFLDELPTREELPALMGQIVVASTSTGVELEEGHYELVAAGKAGHIARYRLKFPVVGSYPQVRGFIDRALVAVPQMSLDGLSLERGDVADGVVTAELDFAVFVRTGS